MNDTVIELKQFSFGYGPKEILHDINLAVREGEYVSMIGPNGAGKSTLLKCINRIAKGGRGQIKLFGKDLRAYTQKELGRLVGYVSQSREQVFPFTVFEFVLMGRYPYLSPLSRVSREDQRVVEETLLLTGLTRFSDRKVADLSGGERQKVYLAGALAQQPKILLLDEPTTHLDPKHHIEIQETISRICADLKITVLHVTHDLNHLFFWSRRIVAIKEGYLHAMGSSGEAVTAQQLNDIFQTEFLFMPHPLTKQPIVIPDFRS